MRGRNGKQGRGEKRALISAAIALVLLILVIIAGTVLRMHSRDLGAFAALKSFLSDTFSFK